ncbi:hypothetical protein G7Y89_g2758 [Cudoniella acicularis]|uniref:Ureidoglycolate hydrolase n=1 Tax=Cudoniella acicularis TaxID=354080 RepID=A0A8H4RSS8_9HELO|nr:hypothetical protein G7Y89_g2758 [Cudoniella acicularis]
MPLKISLPRQEIILEPVDLSEDAFRTFGVVIENPVPALIPSSQIEKLPANAVQANQGTALKYLDVTHMKDLYKNAPSGSSAKAVMNMFVCAPRTLLKSAHAQISGMFPVEILERHPYTTQTFIPLGLSKSETQQARYLVIVAPTLEPSPKDQCFSVPPRNSLGGQPPGRGLPDLTNVRAFLANGSQAVTYGPGTWHAPMAVVGKTPIDFVVVQFANGVGMEDCQEVELENAVGGKLLVTIPAAKEAKRSRL